MANESFMGFRVTCGAGDSIKPGVKRSETPGSPTEKLPEPAERAIAVSIYKTSVLMVSLSAATRTSVMLACGFLGLRFASSQALCFGGFAD